MTDGKWCICLPRFGGAQPKKVQIGRGQEASSTAQSATGQSGQHPATEQKIATA